MSVARNARIAVSGNYQGRETNAQLLNSATFTNSFPAPVRTRRWNLTRVRCDLEQPLRQAGQPRMGQDNDRTMLDALLPDDTTSWIVGAQPLADRAFVLPLADSPDWRHQFFRVAMRR